MNEKTVGEVVVSSMSEKRGCERIDRREVEEAIDKCKGSKSANINGITAEMLQYVGYSGRMNVPDT